jgi:superfamily II DNA or RNA helicase
MSELRDYQLQDMEEIRALYREGHSRVLLVAPTGSGKGTIAAYIVRSSSSKGKRIQFWVNRRTLVHDMSGRLNRLGVDHGVIMAGSKRKKPWEPVQIASIDTLRNYDKLPEAHLVIVDEAHFAVSRGWKDMFARYPDAKFLFLTATPVRLSGEGMCEIADVMVMGPSVQMLIDRGYLVPARVFAPSKPDLQGIRSAHGDYNQKQLSERCDNVTLVGDIVDTWKRLASDRKSVAFAVDKRHAEHIAESFRCAGITATTVTDETSDDEREKIWEDFDNGALRVVPSVGVISYGWDHPICSCTILARPTQSVALYLQQVGRGCRPAPGKTDLLVLDHAGNTQTHGFYHDEREWSLQGGCINKRANKDGAPAVTYCRACLLTFLPGPDKCPACGAIIVKKGREIEVVEAELEELRRRDTKLKTAEEWRRTTTIPQRMEMFDGWQRTAKERGYSPRWAVTKYAVIFGRKYEIERAELHERTA